MNLNDAIEARLTTAGTARMFWFALVLSVALGVFGPAGVGETEWFALLAKIVLNLCVALWIWADARARGWERERLASYAAFGALLTEIAVPVYLVKSRGWRGAGRSALRFLLYLCVVVLILAVTGAVLRLLGLH